MASCRAKEGNMVSSRILLKMEWGMMTRCFFRLQNGILMELFSSGETEQELLNNGGMWIHCAWCSAVL